MSVLKEKQQGYTIADYRTDAAFTAQQFGEHSLTGNAWGIPYVPKDDYVTRLHEGERVLTAQEARGYGGGINVSITGNEFIVREEADIDHIARQLAIELQKAQQVS